MKKILDKQPKSGIVSAARGRTARFYSNQRRAVECLAKLGRGVRASKLAALAKNL